MCVFQALKELSERVESMKKELEAEKLAAAAASAAASKAAREREATAKLTEENYSRQLRLLTIHLAELREKEQQTQEALQRLKSNQVLCGRCGVWNPIGQTDTGTKPLDFIFPQSHATLPSSERIPVPSAERERESVSV